jgi:hypothetical protein
LTARGDFVAGSIFRSLFAGGGEHDSARSDVSEANPFARSCGLYLSRNGDQAVVASEINYGGLHVEKKAGANVCQLSQADELGLLIKKALEECEYGSTIPDLSGSKKSDWPAYRALDYKTIKGFESDFLRCRVEGVNAANLYWRITSPELRNGVELTSLVSPFAEAAEISAWARKFREFYLEVEELTLR